MKGVGRNIAFLSALLSFGLLISACASTPAKSSDTPTRTYDAPFEKVYGASVKAFQNLGLELFQEDKAKGYVEGGRGPGFARGTETVGVFLGKAAEGKTTVSIDNRKGIGGMALAVDWTPKLFDQIEQELKR